MASPKAVGRFYVDTTRRAANKTEYLQDDALGYMDDLVGIGRSYFAIWSGAQESSLQTAFQLQNSLIESVQTIWAASGQANLSLFEEWTKAVAESQSATARLVAAGVSMLDSVSPHDLD